MKRILSVLLVLILAISLCACGGISSSEKAKEAIRSEIYTKIDSTIEKMTFESLDKIGEGQWEASGKITITHDGTSYSGDFEASIVDGEVQVDSDVISQVQRAENLEHMDEIKNKYFN